MMMFDVINDPAPPCSCGEIMYVNKHEAIRPALEVRPTVQLLEIIEFQCPKCGEVRRFELGEKKV